MERQQSWKLRYWIIGGYAVPLLALFVSAGVTVSNVRSLRLSSQSLDHSRMVQDTIANLAVNAQIFSRATRGYLLEKSEISRSSIETASSELDRLMSDLSRLISDTQQQDTLRNVETALADLERTNRQLVELVDQNKVQEAIATWRMDDGRAQIEEVTALLNDLRERENEIVENATQLESDVLNRLWISILTATGISLLVSVFLGAWIISRTSHQMLVAASTIASSTTEIAATVEQQERTANQQAASVNETTTTMDELGASSRQSAEQAEASVAGAKQALDLASNGTYAVGRTIDGMETLRQKVGAIADQILRLSEQTSQIGSISGLVSDLANQTNMLALNAAVEAVRAGDHGKGFAVVAAEIRKLADQSKKSAEKINALVTDIQTAINSTVMVTDEGTKTVEEGVRIAQDTSNSFSGVADAVNNVVLNSQQISLNIKQQAIAIQQVVDAMNALNLAARENASGISQIKVGTQRLNEAALELKTIV